jgi:hypothetical protein
MNPEDMWTEDTHNRCVLCGGELEPQGYLGLAYHWRRRQLACRCIACHTWHFVDLAGNSWLAGDDANA